MVITLCLNPVIQKTLLFDELKVAEVNRTSISEWDASGKGVNVSRVLSQLGTECLYISQSGGDFTNWFIELLDRDRIPRVLVETSANIRFCFTIVDSKETTELVEEGNKVESEVEKGIKRQIEVLLKEHRSGIHKISCFVITGTKAPGFSDDLYPELAEMILQHHIPLVLDYRGKDLLNTLLKVKSVCQKEQDNTDLRVPNLIIKPNRQELQDTFDIDKSTFNIEACIIELHKKYGCAAIITDSNSKIVTYNGKCVKNFDSIKLPIEQVKNTTGCGDAFTAGFASIIDSEGLSFDTFDKGIVKGIECGMMNAKTLKPGNIEM